MEGLSMLLTISLIIVVCLLLAIIFRFKKRISRSRKYFQTMFNALPFPVFVLNEKTELKYCNQAFSTLTGVRFDPERPIKHVDFGVVVDADELQQLIDRDIDLIQKGGELESTVYIEGNDGQRYTGVYRRVVAFHDSPKPQFIGIFTDISELKEKESLLQKNLQEFRNLVEYAPDIMLLLDQDMMISGINQQGEKISGFKEQELIGKPIHRLLPKFEQDSVVSDTLDSSIQIVDIVPTAEEQQILLTKDHQELFIEANSSPVSFFGNDVYLLSIRDVTARIENEAALLNAKLEANLAQQSKSNFLANISHEIRTPMNAILGFSSLAKEMTTDPQLMQFLQKIDSSTNNLLQIVNDILDLSKIDARNMEIDELPFDLEKDVIEEVINKNIVNAEEKQLEVLCQTDLNIPPKLIGDKYRIIQILTNLLSNAVKFTEKGRVNLGLTVTDSDEEKVSILFEVTDTGIGIAQRHSDKLFQSFEQGDTSATRRFGGTGLGLAICKQLVDLMGGEIGVSSTLGKGSTFWFQLTFALSDSSENSTVNVLENSDKRVLIIDSSSNSTAIVKRYVESLNVAEVITTSNVDTAKQLLFRSQQTIDLAFIDCDLDNYGNFVLINLLTDIRQQDSTQVIGMMSHQQITGAKEQDWRALLANVIERPVTRHRVLRATENILTQPAENSQSQEFLHSDQYDFSAISLLLVEDNPTNQELAVAVFERLGVQITIANNGKEAFEFVTDKSHQFDIVFMDIQMPTVDGIKATKLIRSFSEYKDLPIIAMTAHALKGDREKSLAAGMNDHINKPINVAEVYQKVIRWLELVPKERTQEIEQISSTEEALDPKEWPFLTAIPLLDLEQVSLRLDGNKQLITKMIYRYFTNQPQLEQQLLDKISEGDESVAIDLHSFKSINQSIGFKEAAALCIKLEEGYQDTQSYDISLVQELHREFIELIHALENVNWQDRTLGTEKNQQSVEQGLMKVKHLLEEQDTQAVDELEVLIELESDYHKMIKECYALASVYQFDKALAILTTSFKK